MIIRSVFKKLRGVVACGDKVFGKATLGVHFGGRIPEQLPAGASATPRPLAHL